MVFLTIIENNPKVCMEQQRPTDIAILRSIKKAGGITLPLYSKSTAIITLLHWYINSQWDQGPRTESRAQKLNPHRSSQLFDRGVKNTQ